MPKEIDEQFTIGKILGTGAYGEVRLGFHKTSCRRVAVKIINKEQLGGGGGVSQSQEAGDNARKGLTPSLQTQVENNTSVGPESIESVRHLFRVCSPILMLRDLSECIFTTPEAVARAEAIEVEGRGAGSFMSM